MSAVYSAMEFHNMAEHEVRCSERYRRFFSFILMTSESESLELKEALGESLRDSDFFTEFRGCFNILMSETDKEDALLAIKRFGTKQSCLDDLKFSIASFPEDGTTYQDISRKASERLNDAKSSEQGAIASDE